MLKRWNNMVAPILIATFLAVFAFQDRCLAEADAIQVTMATTLGTIVLELDGEKAPITVDNFLQYVDEGFYDGTIFHRVVGNFVIQGGGFDEHLNRKTTRNPIQNEADNGLSNKAYTIAMARTSDPHSATSQFFINLKDNQGLDKNADGDGYAVFGRVIEGADVVDAIGAVPTGPGDIPVEPVVINNAARTSDNNDGSDNDNDGSDDNTCFLKLTR